MCRVSVASAALLLLLSAAARANDFDIPAASDSLVAEDLASPDLVQTDSPTPETWLAMGDQLAADSQNDGAAATRPASSQPATATGRTYVPWKERHGPAYPGDFWTSFGRYGKEMPATLWDDTKATFTNPVSWIGFGLAVAAGISLASTNVDDQIAHHELTHRSQLNTFWDSVGDAGGNPGTHFAVTGVMYFWSLYRDDARNYEIATTTMNALIINDLFTVGLKLCADTRSPNGDRWGWPSGHTSSSFTFATVMCEAYGPVVGVPLLGFAGFVGYERIDSRRHDFSDVISGALIGMAVGHAVMQNHKPRIFGFDVAPYVDPSSNAAGVALLKNW
jgi:membrane-associated phospholipid phosphatase